jgi:hypothetical protein
MGSFTDANIGAWQRATGITPATGARAELLEELSQAAFQLIKIIELERSGIREGDGSWYGGDVVDHVASDIAKLNARLRRCSPLWRDAAVDG